MNTFEQYLLSVGYVRHCFTGRAWVPATGPHFYSSMGDVSYCYRKPDAPDIYYGLHERGSPACLIFPRPRVAGQPHDYPDAVMHRVALAYEPPAIYAALSGHFALSLPDAHP